MDPATVDEAVQELDVLVRGDGAALKLVSADPKTARVEIELDLSGVDCLECVLSPEMLEQMVGSSLAQHIRGEFELVLRDPRRV